MLLLLLLLSFFDREIICLQLFRFCGFVQILRQCFFCLFAFFFAHGHSKKRRAREMVLFESLVGCIWSWVYLYDLNNHRDVKLFMV